LVGSSVLQSDGHAADGEQEQALEQDGAPQLGAGEALDVLKQVNCAHDAPTKTRFFLEELLGP